MLETLKKMMDEEGISASEANVRKVEMMQVELVTKLPMEVRRALNEAVKAGRLGRLKKDGLRPEAYYKVGCKELAEAMREEKLNKSVLAIAKVFA